MTTHKLTVCTECSHRHETFLCRHTHKTRSLDERAALSWTGVDCRHCLEHKDGKEKKRGRLPWPTGFAWLQIPAYDREVMG
jgi:hypothetical protein